MSPPKRKGKCPFAGTFCIQILYYLLHVLSLCVHGVIDGAQRALRVLRSPVDVDVGGGAAVAGAQLGEGEADELLGAKNKIK